MSLPFDAASNPTQGTGNLSWTHTPVGVPAGVIVTITQDVTTTSQITSVTYGGVAMALVDQIGSSGGGDLGWAGMYFLGSSIPTGPQTVAVNVSGAATKDAECVTITNSLGGGTQVASSQKLGTTTTNPSVTLTISEESFCPAVLHSGETTSLTTPGTGLTEIREASYSGGNRTGSYVRVTTNPTTGTQAVAWTYNNDGAALVAAAIINAAAAAPAVPVFIPHRMPLGV